MSSELVVAEIVDILPIENQNLATKEWIKGELANNSPAEVLAACKEYFQLNEVRVSECELSLERQGIQLNRIESKLDAHTAYTDQRFQAVNQQVSELSQQLAVTAAVNNERASTQQFLTGQMMSSINSTQQNVVTAASNKGRSDGTAIAAIIPFLLVPLVLIALGSLATVFSKSSTQVIEYKNVPANGHPMPIPKDKYDRL